MKLRNIIEDDDAVSPVIGVILMVAVTVILAAVIASFVLGMGSTASSAPQASFTYDYDSGATDGFTDSDGDDSVTITHDGGKNLDASAVSVIVDGTEVTSGSWSATELSAGDTFTVSDSSSISLASGDDIRVVWSNPNNDESTTISSSTVP